MSRSRGQQQGWHPEQGAGLTLHFALCGPWRSSLPSGPNPKLPAASLAPYTSPGKKRVWGGRKEGQGSGAGRPRAPPQVQAGRGCGRGRSRDGEAGRGFTRALMPCRVSKFTLLPLEGLGGGIPKTMSTVDFWSLAGPRFWKDFES